MQLLLNFLDPPLADHPSPEWTALDEKSRTEAVAVLARLIAQAGDPREETAAPREERSDE